MKTIIINILVLFMSVGLFAQAKPEQVELRLTDAVEIATAKSLDAFRYKNMYLAGYWQYRYFKADRLPSLNLNSDPIDFRRYQNREYNFQTNEEEYVLRENLYSDMMLSLNQKVGLTGGEIFLSSGLGLVKNLGGDKKTSFLSTPISIGYYQELNGYNQLKWTAKIEPLKYEKVKKEFIQNQEILAMKTAGLFFELVDAQIQVKIEEIKMNNNDTLYQIGKGRFQVGTVTQDELLNLELNLLNSEQTLNRARLEVQRSQTILNSHLALGGAAQINCIVPSDIPELHVNPGEALDLALQNNPEMLGLNQLLLEQDRNVAEAKSENGLKTNLFARFGLDQSTEDFGEIYSDPDQSQRFNIGIEIPIVDWGKRKGHLSMAESNREVVRSEINQQRIDFEQNVYQSVMEFNLQAEQVRIAAKADTVAQKAYHVKFQRFLIGKVDVIDLNLARNDLESARSAYINAVKTYWNYYFKLRVLTLYDFEEKLPLTVEYDKILEN